MNSRRHALSLAAVLAATVLTGGAAILGVTHTPTQQVSQPAAVVQAPQQAQPSQFVEEGD